MRRLLAQGLGGVLVLLTACAESEPMTASGGAGGVSATGGSSGASAGTSGASAGTTGASAGTNGASAGTTGASAGTTGAGGATGGAGAQTLSFQDDIWPVIDQVRNPPFDYRGLGTYTGCTTPTSPCHRAASPGAQLSMTDAATAYANLISVASVTSLCRSAGGTTRVIPGNPDQSCLILFYQGRLKDDLQWVSQAEIDLVRRWIAEGARY
jgi:hypothetical protein